MVQKSILSDHTHNFEYELFPSKKMERFIGTEGSYYKIAEYNEFEEKYISVTTGIGVLTSSKIEEWKEKVGHKEANRISGISARFGTYVHDLCEKYVLGKKFDEDVPITAMMAFKELMPYLRENITKIYGVELSLYSRQLGAAGTSDLIAEYRGKNSVIDYKTSRSKKVKEHMITYFLQTATYALMVEELYGMKIPQLVILNYSNGEVQEVIEDAREWKRKASLFWKYYHEGKL